MAAGARRVGCFLSQKQQTHQEYWRKRIAHYAHPDVLVTTEWVAGHLNDPKIKVIEVDVEPDKGYVVGHIAGSIGWNWQTDLNDKVMRDLIDPRAFSELCRRAGVSPEDTIVFYGDANNWFAAWAFRQFKYHGHKDVRLMNGGRKKWELEKRPMTTDLPSNTCSATRPPGTTTAHGRSGATWSARPSKKEMALLRRWRW